MERSKSLRPKYKVKLSPIRQQVSRNDSELMSPELTVRPLIANMHRRYFATNKKRSVQSTIKIRHIKKPMYPPKIKADSFHDAISVNDIENDMNGDDDDGPLQHFKGKFNWDDAEDDLLDILPTVSTQESL